MDPWPITIAARRSLLTTFESLTPEQWRTPSACEGWTVAEVLAHLVLAAKPPARRYLPAVVRARGSFDRANHALAVADAAAHGTDDLLANFRAVIDHRFAPPGWPTAAPLSDILLHSLDVRVPLGIESDEDPAHYEPVFGLLFSRVGRSFGRGGRPAVRWTATDHDFAVGDGPAVSGTMADLAFSAAGRSGRVRHLGGDGADAVRSWLA